MSITNCPNCNSPVPPGSIFCDNCGFDLRTVSSAGQAMPSPSNQAAGAGSGSITCPTCGYTNIAGSAFCENCGSQLSQPPMPVQEVPAIPPAPVPPKKPEPVIGTPLVAIRGSLVIQSANATVTIPPGKQVIVLGREDPVSGVFPDIDLDPYGAQEEGVGRKHAQLVMRGGDICLEDLESVNGTVVNKQRLVPRQPQPIKDGDELRLGKMVMIYKAG